MRTKIPFQKLGLVFGLAAILSLVMSITAHAQTGEPTVELFRLGGTYVGIKITFPTDVNGNFLGMLAGKSLDCTTTPPNVVYCIGPFQKGTGPSTLFLIDLSTKEIILQQVVYSAERKPPAEVELFTNGTPPSGIPTNPPIVPPCIGIGCPPPF